MRRSEHGQASVELAALLPVVAVVAVLLAQAALAGQAAWLVGSAARAAARATAVGADAAVAARRTLPDHLDRHLSVRPEQDGVRVSVRVPTLVGVGAVGTVTARARLQPQSP